PRPSGSTSMSIAFNSSAVGARPKPKVGDCARITDRGPKRAALQKSTKSTIARLKPRATSARRPRARSAVAIGDAPVGGDVPALNRVVVIVRVQAAQDRKSVG